MINLLPPELKQQQRYAKRNRTLIHYLILLLGVVMLYGTVLYAGFWYSDTQAAHYREALSERQNEVSQYTQTETEISTLRKQLQLIEQLFGNQTRFSVLLNDLAAVLPPGSYIESITLTGEDEKPLQLNISASSFQQASQLKIALEVSDRISEVDIQAITGGDDDRFTASVVLAFEEGGAR